MLCYIPIGITNVTLQGTTTLAIAIALGTELFAIADCRNNMKLTQLGYNTIHNAATAKPEKHN
jgi:hypothetical protein